MTPTQHPSNNDVLRSPAGSTIDQCRPLAITRVQYTDGTPGVWSYWRPSDAERAAMTPSGLYLRFLHSLNVKVTGGP